MNRYFAVETKCGHVGKDKCIYIWFAVGADNGSIAASKARDYKRVKHHHKDAIRQVKELSYEEYSRLLLENSNDPYLHCQNIQQQRKIDNLNERIETDKYLISRQNKVKSKRDKSYRIKKSAFLEKDASRQIWEG